MISCHEEASVEKLSALVCWRRAPQFRPIGAKKARGPIQSAPLCKRSVNICARTRRWLAARPFVLAIAAGRQCRLQIAIAIPIVMAAINFDPVAKGYVQSLARPGGNITGLGARWTEITAKQVE